MWNAWNLVIICIHIGPVHKGTNHIPKAVSDHDPLPDWVPDLNYVRSHALQTPSRSRTGSAHCEVKFVPTAQTNPCLASARNTKMRMHKSRSERALRSHILRIRLSRRITIQNALLSHFKSQIWKSFAFTKGKIRKGSKSRSKTALGTWFVPLWTGPQLFVLSFEKGMQFVYKLWYYKEWKPTRVPKWHQYSAGTSFSAPQSITEKPMEVYYLDEWIIITLHVAGFLHPAIF